MSTLHQFDFKASIVFVSCLRNLRVNNTVLVVDAGVLETGSREAKYLQFPSYTRSVR
jgi:hypothetical protein